MLSGKERDDLQKRPIVKQACELYKSIDRAIRDIDAQLRVALYDHVALKLYDAHFQDLRPWLREGYGEERGAGYREKSPDEIEQYFADAKVLLAQHSLVRDLIKSVKSDGRSIVSKLKDRKIKLLNELLDVYKQLVLYKHMLMAIVPVEFIQAEEKIHELKMSRVFADVDRGRYKVPSFDRSPELNPQQRTTTSTQIIISKYKRDLGEALQRFDHHVAADLKVYKKQCAAIQAQIDERQEALRQQMDAHNRGMVLFQQKREGMRSRVNAISDELDRLYRELNNVNQSNVLSHERRLGDLSGQIQFLEDELTDLIQREQQEREAYDKERVELLKQQRELDEFVEKHLRDLDLNLSEISDIPCLELYQKTLSHHDLGQAVDEYRDASQELLTLQRQHDRFIKERQNAIEQLESIRLMRARSEEMVSHVKIFDFNQLAVAKKELQRIIKILPALCDGQSTTGDDNWTKTSEVVLDKLGFLQNGLDELLSAVNDQQHKREGVAVNDYLLEGVQAVEGDVLFTNTHLTHKIEALETKIVHAEESLKGMQFELNTSLAEAHKEMSEQREKLLRERNLVVAKLRKEIAALRLDDLPPLNSPLTPSQSLAAAKRRADETVAKVRGRLDRRMSILQDQQGKLQVKGRNDYLEILTLESTLSRFFNGHMGDSYPDLNERHDQLKQRFEGILDQNDNQSLLLYTPLLRDYQALNQDVNRVKKSRANVSRPRNQDVESGAAKSSKPGFFSRHLGKFIGGASGFAIGAAVGAVLGIFFIPVTFGFSVPVMGAIGGAIGAVVFGCAGIGVGAAIDHHRAKKRNVVEERQPLLQEDRDDREDRLSSTRNHAPTYRTSSPVRGNESSYRASSPVLIPGSKDVDDSPLLSSGSSDESLGSSRERVVSQSAPVLSQRSESFSQSGLGFFASLPQEERTRIEAFEIALADKICSVVVTNPEALQVAKRRIKSNLDFARRYIKLGLEGSDKIDRNDALDAVQEILQSSQFRDYFNGMNVDDFTGSSAQELQSFLHGAYKKSPSQYL